MGKDAATVVWKGPEGGRVSQASRCDEIIRLIDEALEECGADAEGPSGPAAGATGARDAA